MQWQTSLAEQPWFLVLGLVLLAAASKAMADEQEHADLVVLDGKIVTLSPRQPRVEAVAAGGGRIVAVGDNAGIRNWIGPKTKVLRVDGKLVTPGLIDSHAHLLGVGQSQQRLDLVGTTSQRQIAELVRQRASRLPPGRWVLGRGWDQNDWPQRRFPTHRLITEAAPDRPVYLTRIAGHAGWANRAALELAGIDRNTPDPPGGRILRDEHGDPTGVLIDRAQELVTAKIPPASEAENIEALELAIVECLKLGLTSLHDANSGRELVALCRRLLRDGRLSIRLYVMLAGSDQKLLAEAFAQGPQIGLGDHHLTIRAVKLFADGALGSRGAALLEPYADEPNHKGLLMMSEEEIFRVTQQALDHGFQVCTHAIGDRANRLVLDAYQRALLARPEVRDPRFRIEHAQILDAADIPRFAPAINGTPRGPTEWPGVIASMQPTHCTSDMPWVHDRIGPARAAEGAYVWQKLLARGARICGGSDAPVESLDPLWGIYAAVTRQDHAGNPPDGWYPDQRMTRLQALRSFTLEAAYAAFEEDLKGSLEVGKLADLIVWSKDFLEIPPPEILTTHAEVTILGGEVAYRRKGAP